MPCKLSTYVPSVQETTVRKSSYFRATFLVKSSFESTNFRKYPRRPFLYKVVLSYLVHEMLARFVSCGHEQLNGAKSSSSSGKRRRGKVGRESSYFFRWGLALRSNLTLVYRCIRSNILIISVLVQPSVDGWTAQPHRL